MSPEAGMPVLVLFWAYAVSACAVALVLGVVAWWIASSRIGRRGMRLIVLAGAAVALAPTALRAPSARLAEPPAPAPALEMIPVAVLLYAGAGVVAVIVARVRSARVAVAVAAGAALGWLAVKGFLVAVPGGLEAARVDWIDATRWLLTPTLGSLAAALVGGISGLHLAERRRDDVAG